MHPFMRCLPRKRVRLHARSGQVLIITLLALSILVGLVFYVYNLGDVVNRRMSAQHSADSAAISGAGWMARSMNVVAMNNCAQARMIALAPVLDSLPLATGMILKEATQWEGCIAAQLARGINESGRSGQLLRDGLEAIRARLATQRDILTPVDTLLNRGGFDMSSITHWNTGRGEGALWQAAATLDDLSTATVQSAGYLAQADAVTFGQANGADASFIAPLVPELPAVRGRFDHFKPVMMGDFRVDGQSCSLEDEGGRGGGIPDAGFWRRLGPWANLFQWRIYYSSPTAWEWVEPTPGRGDERGGGGQIAIGGRTRGAGARDRSGGGGYRATQYELMGYRTYGPVEWALRHIDRYAYRELSDTFFDYYMRLLSRIKLDYMFVSPSPVTVVYPDWITDYNQARAVAIPAPQNVHSTMFYLVEVCSSVPPDGPGWLSPGTYRANSDEPMAIWLDGWVDPQGWPAPKIAEHIWKDTWTYETTEDWDLGLHLQLENPDDPNSEPVWHEVYVVQWFIWGGINVGEEVEVTNPANWSNEQDLPAPYLLDTNVGDYDQIDPHNDKGVRRPHFSYLGVARGSPAADVWGSRFSSINPSGSMYAVAQAKVFNRTSWDLWTQDWRASLAPVTMWDDWADRLEAAQNQAPLVDNLVHPNEVLNSSEYFQRLLPILNTYTNH